MLMAYLKDYKNLTHKTMTNTYIVKVSRDDYGYITIKAKTKKEAKELVEDGEWTDDMYTPKGGSIEVYGEVEKI